jgi:di/tricarboxylate transporter
LRFAADHDLIVESAPGSETAGDGLINAEHGVAEVLISPRSGYIGDTVFPGMVTDSGKLVVLAVQRHGEDVGPNEVALRTGDSLLLHGRWDALQEHTRDPNVLLVDAPDAIRRQAIPLGPRAAPALAIVAGMVFLLTTGAVPAAVAGLLAAIAMILLGVVSVEEAHRSLSWTTLILVAGMIPLSTAISETGAADLLAETIVDLVGGGGPYALLIGIFAINALLGQLISNTATALILIPIAIAVAAETGLSPMPLLMCVNVASAAALLTPVATPANVMVMKPGGYQFGDYARLGLPVLLLYFLVAVFLVPVFWPW